ncbi:MAG: glycoside hydrolase family 127 protein [Clostridiaceae bacterium]|nr:glycoside hydrolase family 127 protein [Clostridiaceae bacterium]
MNKQIKTNNRLRTLPLGHVKAQGWIREQLLRSKSGMGGHLDELEPNMIAYPYINGATDEKWGAVKAGWGAEISGNYWYGLIQLAFALDDAELKTKAENWVDGTLVNQREDGYLGTYTDADNLFDDYNAWGTHCGMNALLAYYEATGREDVLTAVHRCMLWFCHNWAGDRKTRYAGCTMVECMALCYAHTGDRRLLDFINEYVDYLDRNDLYKNSAGALLDPELIYNSHHSAGMAASLAIYALAYMAGGSERNLRASLNGAQKIIRKVMQRTGGIPCHAEYLAPRSASVETEYCAFAFFNNSLIHLNAITGDPQYADIIERIAFNGAQGARKKDEKAIAYMSSPNQIFANGNSGYLHNDMQQYAPVYPVACCPVTSVWVVPDYVRSMALTDIEGNLYIAAYGPASIDFGSLRLNEETQYPFRDTIRFTVSAAKPQELTINFRIPGWCDGAELTVNGIPAGQPAQPGTYCPIRRIWQDGDIVSIRLPMTASVSRVDDGDGYAKYPLAVEYGPLLFSLPIPEVWTAVPGRPRTPLPEGWSWWDVNPELKYDQRGDIYEQQGLRKYNISWNVALDEALDPAQIEILHADNGYVWETPQVKLRVPGYKALYAYPPYPQKTMDVYQAPIDVQDELTLELVPFGCTNLRITYFSRAKVSEPGLCQTVKPTE